jgi:hypothetical protein
MQSQRRITIRISEIPWFVSVLWGTFYLAHAPAFELHAQRPFKVNPIQRLMFHSRAAVVPISARALEADIERFRRNESIELPGRFYCREALPTLKKYALDPDPRVREQITRYLNDHYAPEALQALVRQIETYPSDKSAFPYAYAARYPCHFFRAIKVRSLTSTLTIRVNSRNNAFKREEIYLLGCVAPKDPQARKLLEEMSQASFPLSLSENDRRVFGELVTYALAEAGSKEEEEKVLADIETKSNAGDPRVLQSLLEALQGFTNCRILLRYAQLITDKRDGPEAELNPEARMSPGQTEIRRVRLRIGDVAISSFTYALGTKVTGEINNQWRRHTDAEMERIYQRVKKSLESGKASTCHSSR